jgi:elongation factor P
MINASKENEMASYNMNQVKVGLKILVDGDPCVIVGTEFVKPGKGQAFTKVKYKSFKTERVNEKTIKASDSFEGADVMEKEMQYLYSDGRTWTFMDQDTYEQFEADGNAVGDSQQWLKEEDMCQITLWEGNPIVVTPPNFVVLEITETDPGVKGDTSSGGNKPATTETGAVVRVPLFVQIGEKIKIDTRTGEYVSRA